MSALRKIQSLYLFTANVLKNNFNLGLKSLNLMLVMIKGFVTPENVS